MKISFYTSDNTIQIKLKEKYLSIILALFYVKILKRGFCLLYQHVDISYKTNQ